jgi:hypothetical protein
MPVERANVAAPATVSDSDIANTGAPYGVSHYRYAAFARKRKFIK